MRKINIAINGLGRIGRTFLRLAVLEPNFNVKAVNDLGELDNLAYLLKYDSAYGRADFSVETKSGAMVIADRTVEFVQEKDPAALPWRRLDIDVVVEATGVFETYDKAKGHLEAGARRVVISAPAKDDPPAGLTGKTVLMGVNESELSVCQISSNASCTTNAAAPVIDILNRTPGMKKAVLNTVHGYTATQKLVDAADGKDFRRGRAAAVNVVPSTTGAAIAVTKAIPSLEGKFDGLAIRVPVLTGSLVDVTFVAARPTSVNEVNEVLSLAAKENRWQGIFSVTNEPLVSADIVGLPYASVADLSFTRVVDGDLVKVLAWYDNEMGYAHTLLRHVRSAGETIFNL